jgi:hypothetical protein
MKVLSILICTTPQKRKGLGRLVNKLEAMVLEAKANELVEIIFDDSPQSIISVGAKRQRLLEAATGNMIVYIDEGDEVSDFYVSKILKAMWNNHKKKWFTKIDCIGFLVSHAGMYFEKASLEYYEWAEKRNSPIKYQRTPYHRTPINREKALRVGFKNINFGEDIDFSKRIRPLLKREKFINDVMYYSIQDLSIFNK